MCVARLAQSTQNDMFVISSQYLKENTKDEVDFLPVDKHQRFLQIDIILDLCDQASQITQNNKLAISLQYLKQEVSGEVRS